jgi:hypothetical protein
VSVSIPPISVLLDRSLNIIHSSYCIQPLSLSDIVGVPIWHWISDPGEQEMAKSLLRHCLATGDSVDYWVNTTIDGVAYTFRTVATRVGDGVFCTSHCIPPAARCLTSDELDLLRMVSEGLTQKSIQSAMRSIRSSISQSTVSRRLDALKAKLGLDPLDPNTTHELHRIAVAMM